jgi:uncharacterized sporulation protein YeaH/YhbH (DUF444 family)
VDENTFFHDPQSGGTRVMPALELARSIVDARFANGEWNVYIAQASDGDCGSEDAALCANYVGTELLPRTRYFAYVDIPADHGGWFARPSDLWQCYEAITADAFAKRRICQRSDIWPVFRELFSRKEARL